MAVRVDILGRLKEMTAPLHSGLERQSCFRQLLEPGLRLDAYVKLLSKFFGFYSPLGRSLGLNCVASKTEWLRKDLAYLGLNSSKLPCTTLLPEGNSAAQRAGITYVIEGATLGGQVISRSVRESLGLERDTGCTFFAGYGELTKGRWEQTRSMLRSFNAEEDLVVVSACSTFRLLDLWLREGEHS